MRGCVKHENFKYAIPQLAYSHWGGPQWGNGLASETTIMSVLLYYSRAERGHMMNWVTRPQKNVMGKEKIRRLPDCGEPESNSESDSVFAEA